MHTEIEELQDEKDTVEVQIAVHNKELILLMTRSKGLEEQLEKLKDALPVIKELEEASK
jgi:predicted  nucleic acid-binding Zn-ribbon protein|tara:strand:+ start:507 stop:683 length:177 start_codon:yes stop_codon:yes gene_type:complete